MLKICICCQGGLSSSVIAREMKKEMSNDERNKEVKIDFMSFHSVGKVLENYDLICCCPHLRINIPSFFEEFHPQIPLYVLPSRMYGQMHFSDIFEDAYDALQIYEETHANPVVFPNEEDFFHIKRAHSYRSIYGDYHQYLKSE